MAGDKSRLVRTVVLVAMCLLLAQVSPGFSSPGNPAGDIVVAVGPVKHVIRSGDTVSLLAKRYGVPAAAILKANPGINPSRLTLGRELLIPTGGKGQAAPAVAAPASPPESVELRPEKAPQATKPLLERDLTATPAVPPAAQQAAAEKAAPAPEAQTAAPSAAATGQPAAEAAAVPAAAAAPTSAPPTSGLSGHVISELVLAVVILALLVFFLRGFCVNLAAGVALSLLRFFRLGDTIRVAGHEGRVISRGWLYVTLRTLENERVFVTNARLLREIFVVLPPPRDDIEV